MSSRISGRVVDMSKGLVVAVASGKGGTGKTTIATNLALVVRSLGQKVQYIDCDVEEPNGHIFLKPKVEKRVEVTVDIPEVDSELCIACGQCGEICQYGAIVSIKEHVLTFSELCHSCGGCLRVCPVGAIKMKPLGIGRIELGTAQGVEFASGTLQIGNVRSPALIRQVKTCIEDDCLTILDVPPGTSCPVVAALQGVDFVLLVTEPTPFGLNDLKLAVELVRQMGLPFAVGINRYGLGDDAVEEYCKQEGIAIILKFPDDRRIAEAYSKGQMIVEVLSEYSKHFLDTYEYINSVKAGDDDMG